jgi:hypothetical protein
MGKRLKNWKDMMQVVVVGGLMDVEVKLDFRSCPERSTSLSFVMSDSWATSPQFTIVKVDFGTEDYKRCMTVRNKGKTFLSSRLAPAVSFQRLPPSSSFD